MINNKGITIHITVEPSLNSNWMGLGDTLPSHGLRYTLNAIHNKSKDVGYILFRTTSNFTISYKIL